MPRHWLQSSATQVQYAPSDLTHLKPVLVTFSSLISSTPPPPPRCSIPFRFSTKILHDILIGATRATNPPPIVPFPLIITIIYVCISWESQIMKHLNTQCVDPQLHLRFIYSSQQPTAAAPVPLSLRSATGATASSTAIQTRRKTLQL